MSGRQEIIEDGKNTRFSKENQPQNPGRKKNLPELDILLADVLGENSDDPKSKSEAKLILLALVKSAKSGNVQAGIAVLNRAYGMPKQQVEHGGKDGGPIRFDFANVSDEEMEAMARIIAKTETSGGATNG